MAVDEFSFAPPSFKPADALVKLRRDLREVRGLKERGSGFDWKGLPVVILGVDDGGVRAQLARKPARSPSWEARMLRNGADTREWLVEVRKRVAGWDDDD